MNAAPIDVAVVGAGRLGSAHARILSEIPGARLVAVADPDASRAKDAAKARRAAVLTSASELPSTVRAVVVATPTVAHHATAGPLLDRGVACLVEKPLAATTDEARDLVARARRSGAILMVGHVERFNPAVEAVLRQNLRPRFFDAQRVSPFSFRSQDIGVVLDIMIHDLDLILELAGSPVVDVDAVGVGVTGPNEDMANARIQFENGAVANVTASRLALKTERKLRMFAPDCYVVIDFFQKTGQIIRTGADFAGALKRAQEKLSIFTPLQLMTKDLLRIEKLDVKKEEEALKREDEEFLDAVRSGRESTVPGEHGVRALEAADRVLASIKRHLDLKTAAEALTR